MPHLLLSLRRRLAALTLALLGAVAAVPSLQCTGCGKNRSAPAPSASPARAAAPVASGPAAAREIACGAAACRAGGEACCSRGDDKACVPRVAPAPGGTPSERLAPQVRACEAGTRSESSLSGIALCDDSSDCGAGQLCCSQWLWSGAGLAECVPASAGVVPCDFGEVCRDGAPCVTPGTTCYRGSCQLAAARVVCDDTVCGGATPVCCAATAGEPPRCVARADCLPDPRAAAANIQYECSGPSTCAAGLQCLAGVIGSYCTKTIDLGTAAVVCESPSDCPPDVCAMNGAPGSRSRCTFDPERRLRVCDCG